MCYSSIVTARLPTKTKRDKREILEMFSIEREFSKKVTALLTGKETTRVGKYIVPQFGPDPEKAATDKYTEEECAIALQEAVNIFGTDKIVRHLNWSLTVLAQRMSNNDLRAASAGLSKSDSAQVALLLQIAKRDAEAECGTYDDDGELVINRKSVEYLDAQKESLKRQIAKPKFSHLKSAFDGETEDAKPFEVDMTKPGFLMGATVEPVKTDESGESTEAPSETTAA